MSHLVVMGLGQLGRLYGGGALKAGMRVTPILRGESPEVRLADVPPGSPLLVAVGESDLPAALSSLPKERHADAVLIQNELFPRTWQELGLQSPTVALAWVLQKPGLPTTVARTSSCHGRHANTLARIHTALALPYETLPDTEALGTALVSKYSFILAINALGVARDVTLGEWLRDPSGQRDQVIDAAARLGEAHLQAAVDHRRIRAEVLEAMGALAGIPARGRTALKRLERALQDARGFGVAVDALQHCQSTHTA